jgi:hypothetical protein
VIDRLLFGLCVGVFLASAGDFYVAPNGRDDATGRSPSQAWKTLDRVNRHIATHRLEPGDAIQLRGGARFIGGLVLDRAGMGTLAAPIRIGTYGNGRAVLLPGLDTGVLIRETGGITIENLDVRAGAGNHGDGIRCDRSVEGTSQIPDVVIRNCVATGFGWHGIMVDAVQRTNGFRDLVISGCVATKNRHAGIMVYGGNPTGRTWYPHSGISIEGCVATDNSGDPEELQYHSGSGIFMDGVDTGAIRNSVAARNGTECRNERGGPVGIWVHASRKIVIERCESFANQSSLRDGGGFDLDGGSEDSILRWNYSHENHGPGFLVYTYRGAPYRDRGCQIYGNLSWNDGAPGTGYAGIQVGAEEGCQITDLEISRNTVIAPPGSVAAIRIAGHNIHGSVSSNLVVAPPHGILVSISGYHHGVRFVENRYWREDGKPVFLIDNQWPIPDLASWKNATGPDFRFTAEGEQFGNPQLVVHNPGSKTRKADQPRWPWVSHTAGPAVGAPNDPSKR